MRIRRPTSQGLVRTSLFEKRRTVTPRGRKDFVAAAIRGHSLRCEVTIAVDLDDQRERQPGEINEEGADRHLSTEMASAAVQVAQHLPQPPLGLCDSRRSFRARSVTAGGWRMLPAWSALNGTPDRRSPDKGLRHPAHAEGPHPYPPLWRGEGDHDVQPGPARSRLAPPTTRRDAEVPSSRQRGGCDWALSILDIAGSRAPLDRAPTRGRA